MAYCYHCNVFCLLVTIVSPANTVEPTRLPFGVGTRGTQETIIKWRPNTRRRRVNFGTRYYHCCSHARNMVRLVANCYRSLYFTFYQMSFEKCGIIVKVLCAYRGVLFLLYEHYRVRITVRIRGSLVELRLTFN